MSSYTEIAELIKITARDWEVGRIRSEIRLGFEPSPCTIATHELSGLAHNKVGCPVTPTLTQWSSATYIESKASTIGHLLISDASLATIMLLFKKSNSTAA